MIAGPSRWRRLAPAGLAAVGGLLAAAAHPPYGVLPGVFGYALILWALDLSAASTRPLRAAFLTGWAGGTGYLLLCTAWITEPFMIDVAEHGWQAPFAVAFCAGGIGLLWGAAGWLYRLLLRDPASPVALRVLVFAATFGLWEWLRGHALTGFPWDLPGETFKAGSPLSQGAALIGSYGMSVVILFVGAAPAVLTQRARPGRREGRLATLAAAAGLIGAIGLWGGVYIARPSPASARPIQVRIVQPNLPEPPAWSQAVLDRAMERYTTLSRAPLKPGAPAPALIVWPEGAIPETFNVLLAPGADSAVRLRESLKTGQTLLSGGVRVEADPTGAEPQGLYYNTLLALRRDPEGLRLLGVYDKHHLVPFGEYMPFARLLAPLGLRKLVSVSADFTPGPLPRPLRLAQGLVQPLICYEALFPGLSGGRGADRPVLLVNVSDDAWFGRHAGPRQHLNIASYRAIEEGLPMVRATPTGVSAVIDGHGRALVTLDPGAEGVIDAATPAPLPRTAYARLSDGPFWLLVLLGLAAPWLYGRASKLLFDRNRPFAH